jgi:hypothetical protein
MDLPTILKALKVLATESESSSPTVQKIGYKLKKVLEEFGGYVIDSNVPPGIEIINEGEITWQNHLIEITSTEYHILQSLFNPPGVFNSCKELDWAMHKSITSYGPHSSKSFRVNVRSAMSRLRKKFLAVDPRFDRIENRQVLGYRWKA